MLTIKNSTNNSNVAGETNILCGQESDYIAAFELNASSEDVMIEDATIVIGGPLSAGTSIRSITVEDSTGNVIYGPTTVNGNVVTLNNMNHVVTQNSSNSDSTIYVKVEAEDIGFNEDGAQDGPFTVTFSVAGGDSYGRDSGNNLPAMTSTASDPFEIVPVHISNVEFVSSAGTVSVDNTLSTDSNVAILKVVADTWGCTDMSGGDLDLEITELVMNETLGTAGTAVASYEIQKTAGQDDASPVYVGTAAGGLVTFNTSASTDDFVLEAGETAYYVVEAKGVTLAPGADNDSVQLDIDDLDNG